LRANPELLGYYRLLLGFSQKQFYTAELGLSLFRAMEEKGVLSKGQDEALEPLCMELIRSGTELLRGLGVDRVSRELLDDLTLLTLGPQLRGGANVKRGTDSVVRVFEIIRDIVKGSLAACTDRSMEVVNAAGRRARIAFAPDPDIVIREEMEGGQWRNVIAIEIKGGTDFSNIHNRIGEAEKSHQKAREAGYVECWTVVNVERIDLSLAKRESPSTNRFYCLSKLEAAKSTAFTDFRNRIISLTNIPVPRPPGRSR